MRRLLGWVLTGGLLAGLAILVMVAGVFLASESRFARVYDVPVRQLAVSAVDGDVDRGRRVARIWGCTTCHAEDLSGALVMDVPALRLHAPNLTPAAPGIAHYSDRDWARAVRHGVGRDGLPLVGVPPHAYWEMSDDDMGALIAYVRSTAPVDRSQPLTLIRGLGRFLFVTDRLPLLAAERMDHEAPRPPAPDPGPTAVYGGYLAMACASCHGRDSAGPAPRGSTAAVSSGRDASPLPRVEGWRAEDLLRGIERHAAATGAQAGGPSCEATAAMTALELGALRAYLRPSRSPPTESVVQ